MIALGATVAITADHGMNDKSAADGTPNVIYLEDELNSRFGAGSVRVICPIADPFVRHHGALGSFVRVHLRKPGDIPAMMAFTWTLPGIELVLDKEQVCKQFDLPVDREGDFAVFSERDTVVGARREDHDLSQLAGHRLRSHGGLGEQKVPFLLSRPLNAEYREAGARPDRAQLRYFRFRPERGRVSARRHAYRSKHNAHRQGRRLRSAEHAFRPEGISRCARSSAAKSWCA